MTPRQAQIENQHEREQAVRELLSRGRPDQLRLFRLPPVELTRDEQLQWLDRHLVGFKVRLVSLDSGVREDVYIGAAPEIFGVALRFGSPGSCLCVSPVNVFDLQPIEWAGNPWEDR